VIIADPNGAGKTTISRAVLAGTLGIEHFVIADAIAADWQVFENSSREAALVAEGHNERTTRAHSPHAWKALQQAADHEGQAQDAD
jgi:predicted ABC-type ATPase